MKIDVSFLPVLGATFILMFARIGTMVMLMPGLGELMVPARVRLILALVLTIVMFPLHRAAFTIDLKSFGPVMTLLGQELLIGAVLGLTARLTISALQVAGSVIAQQLGLGFVTTIDPTQGQQGLILGNFLTVLGITLIFATDLHHFTIAALHNSYTLFHPGEVPLAGDIAALVTRSVGAAFRVGIQIAGPFLVFGLLFNLGLGVLSRLMPQMQVYFIGIPLSILVGFIALVLVIGAMMGTFLGYLEGVLRELAPQRLRMRTTDGRRARRKRQNTRPDAKTSRRRARARRRRQEPGGQYLVRVRGRDARPGRLLGFHRVGPDHDLPRIARRCPPGADRSRRADRAGRQARAGRAGRARPADPAAGGGRDRRQCHPASAGLVGRAAQAETVQDLADGRRQAPVLQGRAGQFRQGHRQDCALRRLDAVAAVARASAARRPGDDRRRRLAPHHGDAVDQAARRRGGGARRDRGARLPVPVPHLVRAPEDVAARD